MRRIGTRCRCLTCLNSKLSRDSKNIDPGSSCGESWRWRKAQCDHRWRRSAQGQSESGRRLDLGGASQMTAWSKLHNKKYPFFDGFPNSVNAFTISNLGILVRKHCQGQTQILRKFHLRNIDQAPTSKSRLQQTSAAKYWPKSSLKSSTSKSWPSAQSLNKS